MSVADHLLSGRRPMRPHVTLTLMATTIYVVAWVLCAWGVSQGLVPTDAGLGLILASIAYCAALYGAVRSGWTLRFKDPALTKLQLFMGVNFCAAAYALLGPLRSCVLSVLALILTFGIFSLQPRAVRGMALYAVAVMGATMLALAWAAPASHPLMREAFSFLLTATIVPMLSLLALRLNRLRTRLRDQRDELTRALQKIQDMASTDELTGLFNRRRMMSEFNRQLKLSKRSGWPLSVALLDLDHFKQVNDGHGHAVGDDALRVFSQCLRQAMRETDSVARWGGEEFLLLMPDTSAETAEQALERVRQFMASLQVSVHAPGLRLTFSAGLTQSKGAETMERLLERADRALYTAKAGGRNCTRQVR